MHNVMMNDAGTTIEQIKTKMRAFRVQRGWKNEDPKDLAISLVLESAEVLEHFQWLSGSMVLGNKKIQQAIGEELSDVLWWILSLSERLEIDMAEAFEKKMEKNAKKFPTDLFSPGISKEEHDRQYYRIKARTRGGHPLYSPSKDEE